MRCWASGTIVGRIMSRITSRAKKSYTLSPETVAFLEAVKDRRGADSVSAVLEEILQAARREYERASVERAVSDYYSGLSRKESKEQAEWGEFAFTQLWSEDQR